MKKIIKNAIRCRHCGDVIESTHVHDFKYCSCGTVAVDGGKSYLKRVFKTSPEDLEELSEWEDIDICGECEKFNRRGDWTATCDESSDEVKYDFTACKYFKKKEIDDNG